MVSVMCAIATRALRTFSSFGNLTHHESQVHEYFTDGGTVSKLNAAPRVAGNMLIGAHITTSMCAVWLPWKFAGHEFTSCVCGAPHRRLCEHKGGTVCCFASARDNALLLQVVALHRNFVQH